MSIVSPVRTAVVVCAATFAFVSAQPAWAEDPKSGTMTVDQAAAAAKSGELGNRRVCFRDMVTGSRLPRQVCDTLTGWKARGIDPFAESK